MDTPDWVHAATPISTPTLDVGFIVSDDFYYGPENDFDQETWERLRVPVYQPALPLHHRHVDWVLTPALESSTDELVRHYRDLLRLAAEHGTTVSRSHFWLRPFLYSPDGLDVSFSWLDTQDDAELFLSALEREDEGEIYDGMDEGWDLRIVALGGRLFIRDADPDTDQVHACVSCGRAALVARVAPVRARMRKILAELRAELGADYWSNPPLPRAPAPAGRTRLPPPRVIPPRYRRKG
jgi:hypothetical protein